MPFSETADAQGAAGEITLERAEEVAAVATE
jgi:hypothetical protein